MSTESFESVARSYDNCTWIGKDRVKAAIDRLKAAHDREIEELRKAYDLALAQARDPQRLRGTKPETFDGAIEALREFRWQHATNDEDAIPYINGVAKAHAQSLKSEYHRGFNDGQRSMDAEHRAIAMRLRALPLDGGSHENLSQIARAVYHADFGWTQGACAALRDELVRLMGGVSDDTAEPMTTDEFIKYVEEDTRRLKGDGAMEVGDDTCACAGGGACAADCGRDSGEQEVSDGGTADDSADDSRGGYRGLSIHLDGLTGYDVLWNERQKAVCELRYIRDCLKGDSTCNSLNIANAIGAKLDVGDHLHESICDRLIHLLGGDKPSGIDVLRAMDEDGTCPNDGSTSSITHELRECVSTAAKSYDNTPWYDMGEDEEADHTTCHITEGELLRIADRIDEQFDRVCVQQEAVLQSTIDELVEQRDELQAKLDSAEDAMNRAAGRWAKADAECRELQAKLDEYDGTHVELPSDANGNVFRVGCTVRMVDRHPEVLLTVHSMTMCDDGEWLLMARDDEEEYFCNQSASEFEVCEKLQYTAESIVRDLSIGSITESEAIERIGKLNG